MRWCDVAVTVKDCNDRGVAERVLSLVATWDSPTAVYFKGALELASSRPAEALAHWSGLEWPTIPPDYLYTPWRLHRELHPGETVPFEEHLAVAVAERQVLPIVQARYHCQHTDYRASLEAYFQTDPAQWTTSDIQNFYRFQRFAPLARDSKLLLAGALRGDRVSAKIRGVVAEIERTGNGEADDDLKGRLLSALRANPELRQVAVDAAKYQLDLRKAFGEGRFSDVVKEGETLELESVTDETILLVYLSALVERNEEISEPWGQELRRRFPGEESEQWMARLKES